MPGASVGYSLTLGGQTLAWPGDAQERALVRLRSATGVGGGHCALELAPAGAPAPRPGDPVELTLSAPAGEAVVFTGTLDEVQATPSALRLYAHDGLPALCTLELSQVWEDKSADAVLGEVLQAAGLTVGTLDPGPALRRYTALPGPRAHRVAQELLDWMGAWLFIDPSGQAHARKPPTGGADHTLTWGVDLLELALAAAAPPVPGLELRGEWGAELLGQSKAHWLPSDVSGLAGRAKLDAEGAVQSGSEGQPGLRRVVGAFSAAQALSEAAQAWLSRSAARRVQGHLLLSGRPDIQPLQRVSVAELPPDHSLADLCAQPLTVLRVEHHFTTRGGYTTRLEV